MTSAVSCSLTDSLTVSDCSNALSDMIFCLSDSDTGVSRGLTRSGIENKDAFMPDCGVHCLKFASFAALSVCLFFNQSHSI